MRHWLVAGLWLTSCSFILDKSTTQCVRDEDCATVGANLTCVAQLCVAVSPIDAGGEVDAGTDAGFDAGFDAGLGPPGCFGGVPTTDVQFFNACSTASFLRFDNCRVAGGCDGGTALPLARPDAGSSNPSVPLDGGPPEFCYDATLRPDVIFMNGSTNFTPFVRAMVPIVAAAGYVIVWQATSSCTGADTVFNADPARRVMRNPTNSSQSYAAYYTSANVNGTPCLMGNSPRSTAANTEPVDIGQSDIFATSCPSGATPFNTYEPGVGAFADVNHYLGPIQSMAFVVPAASSQRVISAAAARQVLGTGTPVPPWNNPQFWWIRSPTTGTVGIISRGIGVPATEMWGIDQRTAQNMVAQLKSVSTSSIDSTLGLLSIDFADKEKANLRILYYQPEGGAVGYLPDLRPTTRDKQNVRDGHYPLWGPIHLYSRGTGGSISAAARAFITQFTVPRPETQLLDAIIDTSTIPTCAMRVTRDVEMGPMRAFEAPFQCHCYFEAKVNGGTQCTRCNGPVDCPTDAPACNLGYCEKQ